RPEAECDARLDDGAFCKEKVFQSSLRPEAECDDVIDVPDLQRDGFNPHSAPRRSATRGAARPWRGLGVSILTPPRGGVRHPLDVLLGGQRTVNVSILTPPRGGVRPSTAAPIPASRSSCFNPHSAP